MFDLTKLAIEKRRITITIMFLIVVLGLMGYSKLPKAEDPGFTVRKARIITYFPGASPDRVKKLITDKLEKAIQEMPELEYVIPVTLRSGSSDRENLDKLETINVYSQQTNMVHPAGWTKKVIELGPRAWISRSPACEGWVRIQIRDQGL